LGMGLAGHVRARRHLVRSTLLLRLSGEVLVLNRLLRRHGWVGHGRGDALTATADLGMRLFLGRLDVGIGINAIFVGRRWFRSVQAGLQRLDERAGGGSASYLDEVLAFGFCDQRLELGGGESVDKTSFGHDEQQNLGAGEHRELVSL
jgi:hypothetical protein